jgi:3-hydroxyisobutyrate dehydrogenase
MHRGDLEKDDDSGGGAAMTRIAVLGTGKMGSAIVRNLAAAGHELTLWNRTRGRAEALRTGRVARTPAEAVVHAEVVISSLTDGDAVRTVYLGPDGALSHRRGQTFIEMSTAGPDILVELAPAVLARDGRLMVVPIMGSPMMVAAGKGTLLAGGEPSAVDSVRPILELLGTVRYVGGLEDAPRLKLIANTMLAVAAAGAAELEVAGEAIGLNANDVFWVLSRIAPGLESRRAGYLGEQQEPLFALQDLRKDVELATPLLGFDSTFLPLSQRARELVEEAAMRDPKGDIASLVALYREHPVRASA